MPATAISTTIPAMWNSGYSVGDRVVRVTDGYTGVIDQVGAMGSLYVKWDNGGVVSVVVPSQLKRG